MSRTDTLRTHLKYSPHNACGRLVHHRQMVFIITLDITVRCKGCAIFSRFAVSFDNRLDFLACVCGVPLVEHIHYRQHIHSRSVFVGGIDIIVKGYEADIVGRENVVDILPDLNVVAPETAQVFNDNQIDFPRFCVLEQSLHGRSVKACARIPVINININEVPALFRNIFCEYQLLIFD